MFDDCFRYAGDLVDGDMKIGDLVDAKGPRYAFLLTMHAETRDGVLRKLQNDARRQTNAVAGTGRRIKWYFAEKEAADLVGPTLGRSFGITVGYMAPRRRP